MQPQGTCIPDSGNSIFSFLEQPFLCCVCNVLDLIKDCLKVQKGTNFVSHFRDPVDAGEAVSVGDDRVKGIPQLIHGWANCSAPSLIACL